MTIVVLLILAGVSLNAIIGENGIITNAANADFKTQKAVLEEYINQFYVEHFEDIEDDISRIAAIKTIEESKNWIYKGKLGYVVDSDGYVHYFLIIENFPKEIRDQIKVGLGEKSYSDYVNCNDVWGLTEDLKVYYCKNGQNSMDGATLGSLSQENGSDVVFKDGSPLARKIKPEGGDVTKSELRGVSTLTLDSSSEIHDLNEIYNFVNLGELKLQNITLTSLDGIEYLTKLYRIYFIKSNIENYEKLAEISNQITFLFIVDTTNEEMEKFFSYEKGIGKNETSNGVDFPNLAYFGIYGEVHFSVDYLYDEQTNVFVNDSCKHASFSNISLLSNFSEITKKRIGNLFLNNNSIENVNNLYEFPNVTRLRIEANKLKNLNGLLTKQNTDSGEKITGMTKLAFLHAYSNLLGVDETENLQISEDGLCAMANTSLENDIYKFPKNFQSLQLLDISQNSLKHLNYIKEYTSLAKLYFTGNNALLDSGIEAVLGVLESTSMECKYDNYVAEYLKTHSKRIAILNISNQKMKITDFKDLLSGRETYLKKLEMANLTLTDNDGTTITNTTSINYNKVINDALARDGTNGFGELIGLNLKDNEYLTDISFISKMKKLECVELRGTNVTDLSSIANNCTKIKDVIVDNASIVVANPGEDSIITPVEKLFNMTYNNAPGEGGTSAYTIYNYTSGMLLCNKSLIDQLQYSKYIENFKVSYYSIQPVNINSSVTFDLSHTKITNKFYFNRGISGFTNNFKLPKSIENIKLQNLSNKMVITNSSELVNLKSLQSENSSWSYFFDIASNLPALNTIGYYAGSLKEDCTLKNYVSSLKESPLTSLTIYGHISTMNSNTITSDELSYIAELTNLTTLKLYLMPIKDASFVKSLTNLKTLDLHNTYISSLEFLNSIKQLETLNISNTFIEKNSYGQDGSLIDNLEILKSWCKNNNTQTLTMTECSGIGKNEIEASGITSLGWKSISY